MEFLSDPVVIFGLGGLGVVIGGVIAWFRKKKAPTVTAHDTRQQEPEQSAFDESPDVV